jgi:ABC-type Fe3+/spermidine/putrescine transport system ATPase subunit
MRIAVHDLTKRFGPLEVVSRAGFSIGEGELFTLLGPSGCGKTTLLRLIAGFYTPDEGEIRFDDQRCGRT